MKYYVILVKAVHEKWQKIVTQQRVKMDFEYLICILAVSSWTFVSFWTTMQEQNWLWKVIL